MWFCRLHVCSIAADGYGECKGAFEWFRVEEYQNTSSGDDTTDIFQISISASRSNGKEQQPELISMGGVWVFEHEGDDFEGAFREWIEHHWAAKGDHEKKVAKQRAKGHLEDAQNLDDADTAEDATIKEEEGATAAGEGGHVETDIEDDVEVQEGKAESANEQTSEGVSSDNHSTNWHVATRTILTGKHWLARTRKNRADRSEGKTEVNADEGSAASGANAVGEGEGASSVPGSDGAAKTSDGSVDSSYNARAVALDKQRSLKHVSASLIDHRCC